MRGVEQDGGIRTGETGEFELELPDTHKHSFPCMYVLRFQSLL